ncbi:MAG: amidase, partial [Stenotrophomonas maltophilia]
VIPVSWSLDTVGILVRTVDDAAVMLQAMAGHDPKDPGSSHEPVPDYLAEMKAFDRPPSIGVLKGFFYDRSSQEVRDHTESMVQKLTEAGAAVREINLPKSFATAHSCQRIVMNVECAAYHQQFFIGRADDYGPNLRANIEMGMLVPGVEYLQAQRLRREFRRDMVELAKQVDVLLTPTTPDIAPRDLNTTGDAAFQSPWTSAGLPTVTVPTGLSEAGLPLAIQLAALPFEEGKLLAAARWCETACGVNLRPPDFI